MRHRWSLIVLAAAALAPTAGCIIAEPGYVGVGAGVAVVDEHHYLYYPDWCAYRCVDCDDWWVLESGAWVRYPSRPARFSMGIEVAYVEIEERGPQPFLRFEDHRRRYPPGWRADRDREKGPPQGRGGRQ